MESMFDSTRVDEVKGRLGSLRRDSARVWGSMTTPQMVAHCCRGMEMATGDNKLPRVFVGRILGPLVKGVALKEGNPMRRNSPTAPALVVKGEPDFEAERERLRGLIERFAVGGPAACTEHPHAFFGKLTPAQWSMLMYKHLDHHLRQFGA
jgi:hypothetical protein